MIPFERRYEVVDDDSYAAWYPVIKEKYVWMKIYLLSILYKTQNSDCLISNQIYIVKPKSYSISYFI